MKSSNKARMERWEWEERRRKASVAVVEQVDTLIRILDYLAGFYPEHDVQEVFDAKMAYNAQREDHKHEARRIAGGKQF